MSCRIAFGCPVSMRLNLLSLSKVIRIEKRTSRLHAADLSRTDVIVENEIKFVLRPGL